VGGGPLWPWWGSGGGQLIAFHVSNPALPSFDSEVNLATNDWWGFSQPFPTGTRVYLSHSESLVETNSANPDGIWIQLNKLDVVDYADSSFPTVRQPVDIPGTLQGMSHEGELLYTMGLHWGTNQVPDWTQWLDASAYDGVAAHLVASLALPDSWPHPLLLLDTNIFIGRPGYSSTTTNVTAPHLETWSLTDAGLFSLNGSISLNQPAYTLVERNGLLVTQENDGSLELFDDTVPTALSRISYNPSACCFWSDINNADGSLQQGLWLPLSYYGVEEIPVGQ
jgi:hypothetical protein